MIIYCKVLLCCFLFDPKSLANLKVVQADLNFEARFFLRWSVQISSFWISTRLSRTDVMCSIYSRNIFTVAPALVYYFILTPEYETSICLKTTAKNNAFTQACMGDRRREVRPGFSWRLPDMANCTVLFLVSLQQQQPQQKDWRSITQSFWYNGGALHDDICDMFVKAEWKYLWTRTYVWAAHSVRNSKCQNAVASHFEI